MDGEHTIVYLIRHAKSIANEKRLYNSRIEDDLGLNEYGKEQAKELGQFFKNTSIGKVYSSPFKRTLQTAQEITSALGQDTVVEVSELKELNCGEWEGYTENEIGEKFPDAWKGWHIDPQNNPIPGGESLMEVQSRALPALNKIIKNNKGKEIVVVTHYCVFNVLLCSFISSLANFRCFDTKNGTIAKITMDNVPRLRIYSPPKSK